MPTLTLDLPDGPGEAYLAAAPDGHSAPGVLFIVDAIGLRPQIERMAAFAFRHADNDVSMPPEAVSALGDALAAAGLEAVNEVFPGPHGYSMADTAMYDEESAERHFASLRALLDRTLER